MKTETKYIKLTHEAAFKLLQDNNWHVDGVTLSISDCPETGTKTLSLAGIHKNGFVSNIGTQWSYCWKVEQVQVFEIWDWVIDARGRTGLVVGFPSDPADAILVQFSGVHKVYVNPDDLELAPDYDPFDKWYEEETNLAGKHKRLARFAFDAGRDYERNLHE